jgi:acyl-coenzyme A thioesterase PaaI-like protein
MRAGVYQENAHDHLRAVYIGRVKIGERVLNQFEEEWTIIELFDEGETVVLESGGDTLVLPRRLVERP